MAAYAFFCKISIFCVGFKPISGISFKIRTLFAVSYVACILMHERITHGTLFTTFRAFMISCNKLHATRSVIPYCSVHLDARMISPLCRMKCGDFWACFFVQQVARYRGNSTSVLDLRFRATSCTLRGNSTSVRD